MVGDTHYNAHPRFGALGRGVYMGDILGSRVPYQADADPREVAGVITALPIVALGCTLYHGQHPAPPHPHSSRSARRGARSSRHLPSRTGSTESSWSSPFPRAAPGPSAAIATTLLQPKVLPVTPNSRSARARPDHRTPALASPSFTPYSITHPLRASSSSSSRRLPPACQRTARRRCPPTTTTPSSFPWPA